MVDRPLVNIVSLVDQLRSALEGGARAKVNDIIEQLIAARAPMGAQWQQIAYVALGNGELTLARGAIDRLVEASGGGPQAQFQKASFLSMMGATHEANGLLLSLPDTVPDRASNAYIRGISALGVGRPEEARDYLEQATRMRPDSGLAWFALSMATDLGRETALADRLIAAGRSLDRMPPAERAPYHYALGRVLAARGEHAGAFDAFARGAQLMKPVAVYHRDQARAEAARATDGYTAERIAAIAATQSEATDRTIFVTGLPRSGTTLVEQILTSHSAVRHGGETGRLILLGDEVGGASHAALANHVAGHGAASPARLWQHWLDELYGASGRVIDKTLNSSRFLGLAASLLPQAPLIWMTRDPLDCAWSCFRTNFSGSAVPWSYDLQDIAAHFRLEDQLLARWLEILGDRLLVLSYEALVSEPEVWIRRILAHCGLAEEAAVFAPHENRRPVPTASMMQVRKPINRDAIGAAEPYRRFLEPFLRAYR